jgi:hypothetical protein
MEEVKRCHHFNHLLHTILAKAKEIHTLPFTYLSIGNSLSHLQNKNLKPNDKMTPIQHVDTSIDKHLMVSNDLNFLQ